MMFCELFETEKHPLHLLRICYEKGIAKARRVLYTFSNSFAKTSKLCQSMSHTIGARPPSSFFSSPRYPTYIHGIVQRTRSSVCRLDLRISVSKFKKNSQTFCLPIRSRPILDIDRLYIQL